MVTPSLALCVVVTAVMVTMATGQRAQRPISRYGDEDLPECEGGAYMFQDKDKEEDERSRRECPENAVCADVWDTIRDWYNGTRCRDYRVMFNCLCPGNRQCPIDNPAHQLFANDKQSQFMCQPACELRRCSTRVSPAKELVERMPRRRGYTYYRINCRCHGHHTPLSSLGRGRLNRATTYMKLSFNRPRRLLYTQYKCRRVLEEFEDPCSSVRAGQ